MSDLFLHRVRHIWLSVEVNNQSATRIEKKKCFHAAEHFGPGQEK
jgi:hypothetical protein